jgi:hypothetical protein
VLNGLPGVRDDEEVELHLRGKLCLGEEVREQQVRLAALQILPKVKDHLVHLPQVYRGGQGTVFFLCFA